jgi:hypothetical protein
MGIRPRFEAKRKRELFSVWPETHVFALVVVLLLVLVLEFPKFFEDEDEHEDEKE